jgi:hypothetical protein
MALCGGSGGGDGGGAGIGDIIIIIRRFKNYNTYQVWEYLRTDTQMLLLQVPQL